MIFSDRSLHFPDTLMTDGRFLGLLVAPLPGSRHA